MILNKQCSATTYQEGGGMIPAKNKKALLSQKGFNMMDGYRKL